MLSVVGDSAPKLSDNLINTPCESAQKYWIGGGGRNLEASESERRRNRVENQIWQDLAQTNEANSKRITQQLETSSGTGISAFAQYAALEAEVKMVSIAFFDGCLGDVEISGIFYWLLCALVVNN
ncbi:hypothetical protein L6452_09118 [Arctium lappa]|uniref:Uncharacterized protein n=1 Tax=Arctium lappa TaxID=4217 RepID=A0ACB9DJ34_ARCLA|nr:hypothetical protein L6452_09118 [Arctium lappa]